MKVILREDVPSLGRLGEIVDVREGYARNFLLPQRKALPCTADAEKQIEAEKRRQKVREEKRLAELKRLAEELNGKSVTITMKADQDRLYASVGAKEIVDAIAREHKVKLPETSIVIEAPFKTLGTPDVPIRVAEGSEVVIKVWIVAEATE